MADIDQLRERVARVVDPETWDGIDKMEAIGRDAPFLRAKSEVSLAAADRVVDILMLEGLEALFEEIQGAGVKATAPADEEADRPWRWRNLRAATIQIGICWPPRFTIERSSDVYGFHTAIACGLVTLVIAGGIGNSSSEKPWERVGALSESEAWERAAS